MSCKILFSGDFVLAEEIYNKELFSNEFKSILSNHDIFCCNLEGPVANKKMESIKKIGPNICNSMTATKYLIENGGNLLCLANNHIFDYGTEGIKNTISFLKKYNVNYIGAGLEKDEVYKRFYKEVNGIKISIINIAENGFGASIDKEYGYAYAFDKKVKKIINEACKDSDFVIIVSHMGAEHWDFPLPEVREFYKELIDCGAAAVIAHHPHVPQGWEKYNNGFIFYSLGNFVFNKGIGIQNPKSFLVSLELSKDKNINYKIVSIKNEDGLLYIDNKDYSYLNEYIEDNLKYEECLNKKIMSAYEKYKNSYFKVVSYDRGNLKEKIKGFIKRNIMRKKFQELWLYHNLNIETHYWICKRATRIFVEEKIKERENES